MMLSPETLQERYGHLTIPQQIRKMIEDDVDTEIIMDRVQLYGQQKYNDGVRDQYSRAQSRPGFGDMGG